MPLATRAKEKEVDRPADRPTILTDINVFTVDEADALKQQNNVAIEEATTQIIDLITEGTKQKRAAAMLAEGGISIARIEKELGLDKGTLQMWIGDERFQALVKKIAAKIEMLTYQVGLARPLVRVRAMENRHRLLETVIKARQARHRCEVGEDGDPVTEEASGLTTSFNGNIRIDKELLVEMRELERLVKEEMESLQALQKNVNEETVRIRSRRVLNSEQKSLPAAE